MVSDPISGAPSEISCQGLRRGVHQSGRHPLPRLNQREAQVTVIADDKRTVNLTLKHIKEQMRGHVHIGPLLLTTDDACHE